MAHNNTIGNKNFNNIFAQIMQYLLVIENGN